MNKKTIFTILLVLVAATVAIAQTATTGSGTTQTTAVTPVTDTNATAADTVTSSSTIQVSGSVPASDSGLSESVNFSGPVVVTSSVTNDPALGLGTVVQIDGKGINGTGSTSGTAYTNGCEAILTRPYGSTDTINLTFAFFDTTSGSYLRSKTAQLNVTLTYDATTKKVTQATGSVASFKAAPQPVPAPATTVQ